MSYLTNRTQSQLSGTVKDIYLKTSESLKNLQPNFLVYFIKTMQ